MTMRSLVLALVLAFATVAGSRAADDPTLAAAADITGTIMFLNSGAPGMVLVIVRGDQTLVRGYGETEPGNKHTPDGTTLLRIGSVTKVFTTEVLASLAAEGKLVLTDPLQRFAAGGAKVPAFGGARPITLLDLATHSAALPREITGDAPEGATYLTWPTRDARWKWLSGYALPWAPGTTAVYSNIGFNLLSDAIEAAGGQPYPDLLRSRVTGPLGMVDTVFAPTPEQCARLMTGTGFGGPGPCVDTRTMEGSGGLYGTGDDMARWLRHNLADSSGVLALSHAVYRPRQAMPAAAGFDEAGPMAGLGLGWVTTAAQGVQPTIVQKSGGLSGFMSYVAFAPGRGVGVFVAVNRVDFAMFSALAGAANNLTAELATR
jgi:D-alanyl-D-alanine-carboxypeptidase/D-alanyl-D-alanine-endopeptidase